MGRVIKKSVKERFLNFVNKNELTNCWEWTGYVCNGGYGRFGITRRISKLAHRVSYEMFLGKIPSRLHIDHLCRNRKCVNPEHLEAVTQKVNTLRGDTIAAKHKAKTHCPQGHLYDKENTYYESNGARHCRLCREKRWRTYVRKK